MAAPASELMPPVFHATAAAPHVSANLRLKLQNDLKMAQLDADATEALMDQVAAAVALSVMDQHGAMVAAVQRQVTAGGAGLPAPPATGTAGQATAMTPQVAEVVGSLLLPLPGTDQAAADAQRAKYEAQALEWDVRTPPHGSTLTREAARAARQEMDAAEAALSAGGSVRTWPYSKQSLIMTGNGSRCPGLSFLLDWVEGLVMPSAPEERVAVPCVALSVHLQRTPRGFGLQIGYSTELRRLVVEGVYDFVQSSNGWPVCKGDILTAVDQYPLPPHNNGQLLIDNVVHTFGRITEQTCVHFQRPVNGHHATLLMAVRRSLVRLLRLERDLMRWFPGYAPYYVRNLLERINSTFIALYTRPCGHVAAETDPDPPLHVAVTSEAARLREWTRIAALLAREASALERGM